VADIMLDLETMGGTPQAAIIAIGACAFDIGMNAITSEFYEVVALESAVRAGGVMDPSTVLWWMRQNDAARSAFERPGLPIVEALDMFSAWLGCRDPLAANKVWGNGASFDNVIFGSAYRNCQMVTPWSFWNDRCYRTMKNIYANVPMVRTGTAHNALEDAKSQALHLMAMFAPQS
jgi:hypothetical protein